MRLKIIILLLALVPAIAEGQNACRPLGMALFNSSGTALVVPFAAVQICNTIGVPCTSIASPLFKDAAGTLPLVSPFTADANGNYQWCSGSGTFFEQVTFGSQTIVSTITQLTPTTFSASRTARAVTGTVSSDTIAATDCGLRRIAYQSAPTGGSIAVTLPSATTLGSSGCWLTIANDSSNQSVVVITPTSWTFTYQGQTGITAIYLPYHLWCMASPDAAASTWDLDCSDPDMLITAPFSTGANLPTIDATAQVNATINARCPVATSGSGCMIKWPANGHFLFHPATGVGTQFAVSIQRNGVVMGCAGGTGPQYNNQEFASSCTAETDLAGLWPIGVGLLGATQPIAGPYIKDIAFRDISANRNAAGAIIVNDTNGVRLENVTLNNGFHAIPVLGQAVESGGQPGAATAPATPSCAVSAGGSLTQPTTFTFSVAAWSTSGPSIWSAASAGCTTSSGQQTITISGLPAIGSGVIGYELAAKRTADSNYCTFSAFSNTINTDGSVTFVTPANTSGATFSGTTAVYTNDVNLCAVNFKRGPPTFGATTGAVTPTIDMSRSLGILAQGSSNWNGLTGNTNELKNTGEHCFNCETAFVSGVSAAASEVLNIEFGSCDFNASTGVCQTGQIATLGAIVGLGGLRMLHGHYSGSGSAQGCSSGVVALLTGFINTITDSFFETSCAGSGSPVSMISAKRNKVTYTCSGSGFANPGTMDANTTGSKIEFNDNTTCGTAPTISNGANEFHRVGNDYSLGSAGTIRTGVSTNTDMAGTLTASGSTASYTFSNTTYVSHPICQASDETTVTSAIKITYTAATSVTFTTPGATDVIDYSCVPRN